MTTMRNSISTRVMMTMSKNSRYGAPVVRLSSKERMIVQYITGQLEAAYRNTAGKPVYAKNMDQVMKDIFGIKKFTKTLEKARYNEQLMISLMKRLDTETLWQITRSKEHYKLLCTLVALDKQIVSEQKRYEKMANMEPAERPTRKMRKIAKDVKRKKKAYKQCVKTFRNIFDIEKIDKDDSDSILDSLNDWLDRHDTDDDIFYGMGYDSFDMDAIESMDAYVRKASSKKGGKKRTPVREGALDIFDHRFDDDDDEEDIFEDDDDGDESAEDRLMRKLLQRLGYDGEPDEDDSSDDDDVEADDTTTAILKTIRDGFTKMSDSIGELANSVDNLYDVMTEDDDEPQSSIPVPTAPKSVADYMNISEAANRGQVPQDAHPVQERPMVGEEIPEPDGQT